MEPIVPISPLYRPPENDIGNLLENSRSTASRVMCLRLLKVLELELTLMEFPLSGEMVSFTAPRRSPEKPGGDYRAYSCPFRKRNPVRFNVREYQTCALSSFSDISKLKRHIRTVHGTTSCGLEGQVAVDPESGLSTAAEAKLRDRRANHQVLDWKSLWGVLFPGDTVIPSAEYEPVVEDHDFHRWLVTGKPGVSNTTSLCEIPPSMKPGGEFVFDLSAG
ncbi:hypothetical protein V8F20_004389 [Naviculisporaceae sp. PSN 640]